jgi:hypothetical protein
MAKLPTRLVKARYNVTERTLDRWERDPRLNFPKPEIINRRKYRVLLARPPLVGNCELILDETGCGRPAADLFDTTGLKPTRVTITAGAEQSFVNGSWHVSKQTLVSTLDARLHTGELRFAKELLDAETLREELRDFRRHVSTAGRYSFEARVGKHDDLVLAVAIGLWALVGRPKTPIAQFGTWGSSVGENQFGYN